MAFGPRLARLCVERPGAVLLAAACACVAVTPLCLRLQLDTDLVNLVPASDPHAAAFVRFTRSFGKEQPLIALAVGSDPVALAGFADRYAERLRARPEIAEVRVHLSGSAGRLFLDHLVDLLTDADFDQLAARISDPQLKERASRLRGLLAAPGGSAMAPLLTADPLELLPLVRERLQAGLPIDPTSGYFKSPDGQALLLFIRPRPEVSPFDVEAGRALLAAVSDDATAIGAKVGDGNFGVPGATPEVGFTGVYAHTFVYRDWLHRDLMISTVASAAAVLFFFAFLLGAVRAVPLVAVPLHVGLWLTGASASAIYGHVNAVSLAFGSILLAIGIDLPIQIYNRLREELRQAEPRLALQRTIERLAGPALLATLGPAAVFFACALSDYRGLSELGVLAGVGLLLNLLAMLTVLPALLGLIPPRFWVPRQGGAAPRGLGGRLLAVLESAAQGDGRGFAWFGRLTARRPLLVLAATLVVALAAVPAALRLRIERHLISSVEPAGMPAVRVQHEMERRFGGRHQLMIALCDDADPERALAKSDAWRAEAERMRAAGLLASYESVSTVFPSRAEQERRRARFAALDPTRIARTLGAALEEAGFDPEPFRPALDRLSHPPPFLTLGDAGDELGFLVRGHVFDGAGQPAGATRTVATFFYPREDRLAESVAAMERFAVSSGTGAAIGGIPVLEEALHHVVARDTRRVTLASVMAVTALLALYYRRARPALAVLLPLSLAGLFFCALLGAASVPLNLFNLLAVPLVVGYGIDDHVFLLHRYEENGEASPARALASTGRAIVVTSLSTMAGFAGLAAARFDGLRLLGITGTLAVGLCLLAAMAMLPALLALLRPGQPLSDRRGGTP